MYKKYIINCLLTINFGFNSYISCQEVTPIEQEIQIEEERLLTIIVENLCNTLDIWIKLAQKLKPESQKFFLNYLLYSFVPQTNEDAEKIREIIVEYIKNIQCEQTKSVLTQLHNDISDLVTPYLQYLNEQLKNEQLKKQESSEDFNNTINILNYKLSNLFATIFKIYYAALYESMEQINKKHIKLMLDVRGLIPTNKQLRLPSLDEIQQQQLEAMEALEEAEQQ